MVFESVNGCACVLHIYCRSSYISVSGSFGLELYNTNLDIKDDYSMMDQPDL